MNTPHTINNKADFSFIYFIVLINLKLEKDTWQIKYMIRKSFSVVSPHNNPEKKC